MDQMGPQSYLSGMRFAALLFIWIGVAAPAMAQACDVSGDAGDVFRASLEGGKAAVGWDVKRMEDVGEESDHFARPRLSLTFEMGGDGKLVGPVAANVRVSTYSDRTVGQAPPLSTMHVRMKADGRDAVEWAGAEWLVGETQLAGALRDAWPRKLVIDIVGPDGELASSGTFDMSLRSGAQKLARRMPASCFR